MENIAEYVKSYLILNRSVEISGLGRFSTEQMGAQIHPVIHEFIPPQSLLLFEENQQCMTTPAFAGFVADKANVTIEEAFNEIQQFSNFITEQLRSENSYNVEFFGTFRRNPDHTTTFEASEQLQLNLNAFGMPSFTLQKDAVEKPFLPETETVPIGDDQIAPEPEPITFSETENIISEIKDEPSEIVSEQEPKILVNLEPETSIALEVVKDEFVEEKPLQDEPETLSPVQTETEDNITETSSVSSEPRPETKEKRRRSYAWLIILLIFIFAAGGIYFTGYWSVIKEKFETLTAKNEKTETVKEDQKKTGSSVADLNKETLKTDSSVNTETVVKDTAATISTAPSVEVPVQSTGLKYYIVADCYINLYLAEMRVKELQSQGFRASLQGKTAQGLFIVAYSDFSDKAAAEAELQSIRQNTNKNAWLLIK